VMLGYWRQPELTDTVFLPDPADGHRRLYRTGDLGRLWPDGCLEYLGRKDTQTKVSGQGVNVVEIEFALQGHAAVKEATVVAHEARPGDQRLVAYLVPAIQPAPTIAELRRLLAITLPAHMIPSRFVLLDALPRTPTGKIDRRALSASEGRKSGAVCPPGCSSHTHRGSSRQDLGRGLGACPGGYT